MLQGRRSEALSSVCAQAHNGLSHDTSVHRVAPGGGCGVPAVRGAPAWEPPRRTEGRETPPPPVPPRAPVVRTGSTYASHCVGAGTLSSSSSFSSSKRPPAPPPPAQVPQGSLLLSPLALSPSYSIRFCTKLHALFVSAKHGALSCLGERGLLLVSAFQRVLFLAQQLVTSPFLHTCRSETMSVCAHVSVNWHSHGRLWL